MSVFAAVQLKSVLWSSYRAHARPPSCRVVHRYPLIVCHFGVECKFASACAKDRTQKTTTVVQAIPFEASNGENPMWTRRTSCTAPRPRPQSTPQGRTLRCAPSRWRGRPAQAASGCAGLDKSGRLARQGSAKPKHLRVIYANNLTMETRQCASTVMLHGDLYLPRE